MAHNSTPSSTDNMIIERGNALYKCSFTDWGNSVNPPYVGSTYGIAIQTVWGQIAAGYNQSGRHYYGSSGTMWNQRTDGAGAYTLSNSASGSTAYHRPNTRIKIGGAWYAMGANGTAIGGTTAYGPMNVWYRRSLISWSYTNVELDTATSSTGSAGGLIQGISFQCYSIPNSSYNIFPSYKVGLKLTSNSTNTTNYSGNNSGSYTEVYTTNPRAWSVGWNDLLFPAYFTWT